MSLIDRAKNIIVSPKTEWDVIATESTPPASLITGYVLPLAAAAAVAGFIGSAIVLGMFAGAFGMGAALIGAIVHVVMAVVSVFVLGFIIDALAPTFGGQKDFNQAVKVCAYSYTPAWVFGLLAIIPFLGSLAAIVGGLYGIYLLYLGLPKLMKSPEEKSVPYLIVVIICAIVLWAVIGMLSMCAVGGGIAGAGLLGSHAANDIRREVASAKLEEYGRKMEEANKKMEAAQKSGDPNKQMEASMAALGTAISGGKGVEPVQIDQLKPMVPATFAGLPKTDDGAERGGVAGLMTTKVNATYSDPGAGKNVHLEIVDSGGAAGLMALAGWMNVQSEREQGGRMERTRKEGNRLVQEMHDKNSNQSKYSVVLGERFVVTADGSNVDLPALKSAVASLDLGKLESMK
jgi:hypothetical protein